MIPMYRWSMIDLKSDINNLSINSSFISQMKIMYDQLPKYSMVLSQANEKLFMLVLKEI
jgi:hypothetical protein